jgi:predicted ATPase/DNA-binding winged helix-turn-helix (wHTH) protein
MAERSAPPKLVLSFGRFELFPNERLLTADGVRVEIGARTLDTLIALASRPNQAVGKRQLMAEVWPDVTVDEGSLRFHVATLRKALGDGKNGARYIATLAGRGYCFVAPVSRAGGESAAPTEEIVSRATFLPFRLERIVGREDDVRAIARDVIASRFVTITGPGGVGKTTVAVAVAHDLIPDFRGAALFVDFGLLSDPRLAPSSVASMLGLSIQSDDPAPSLIAHLSGKRMLLILDNCEHLIDQIALLATRIFLGAPEVYFLATSREPLRVTSERVHRLGPLEFPPDDPALTAAQALSFPAAKLFFERAKAAGGRLELTDEDARVLAGICRKLDGVALAIELAAGRVEAFGLRQTAALLDQRFTLAWPGHRAAPARQRTLRATLDWSYGLLPETERAVLRRLTAFVGRFSLKAALAVVANSAFDGERVFAAIDALVAKSMLAASPAGGTMRYRLLDVTRTYAREIAAENGELAEFSARHAAYCREWLEQTAAAWPMFASATERTSVIADLNDVRAALDWCFGEDGNDAIGVELASAAVPIFFTMSMLTECQRWSQRALLALDGATLGSRQEMRLQAALGLASMWTQGNSPAAQTALNRSLAVAEDRGDTSNQILLYAPLHVYSMRIGQFRVARQYADRVAALARTIEDPTALALSRILSGYSLHFQGELGGARQALEAALRRGVGKEVVFEPPLTPAVRMQDDAMAAPILELAWSAAPSALARTLWLQGQTIEALDPVNATIRDTARAEHPVTMLVALMYAISVLLWNGDHDEAEEQIARFQSIVGSRALPSHVLLGACFQAQLAIGRGDMNAGISVLRASLEELRALRYELFTTAFNISLVQALTATGGLSLGATLIDDTIRSVEAGGDLCYMPELLRVKAELLLASPQPLLEEADFCLSQSLAWSRRQGARAWELRTSIDLAKRLAAKGRPGEADALLRPVFDRFVEGTVSGDLRIAKRILEAGALN